MEDQGIVRHDRNSRLPTGYTLNLVGDLCIIVPHNPDGTTQTVRS
jgi:hypothetical protein